MVKNSSTFNFNKLPKGFLIFLLMVFVFEILNIVFDNYFYASPHAIEGLGMNIKNKVSQNRQDDFDIVVLGDCYNLTGINPAKIEEKTGLTCWNFATYAWQTSFADYLLFSNYIRTCKKNPKVVIIGYIPQIGLAWSRGDVLNTKIHYLYEFKQGNIISFARTFGFASAIKMFMPSLEHQGILKRFFAEPRHVIKGIPSRKQLNAFISSIYKNKGYDARVEEGVYTGGGIIEDSLRPINPFFKLNLEKILDLALENDIKVICLIPSSPKDQHDLDKYLGFLNQYKDYSALCSSKYPNMYVLHPQHILNSNNEYGQMEHLNKKGMNLLSGYLSDEINRLNFH